MALGGCAGPAERGLDPIRGGPPGDAAPPDGPLDAAVPPPDAAGDAGPPPDRQLWLIDRAQAYDDGVRARLEPPHAATGDDPRAALPEAALLIDWSGPADDPRLRAAWAADRPAGVLYRLGDRIAGRGDPTERRAVAVADVSALVAALDGARRPLLWRDAPLVLVDGSWDRAMLDAFEAARDRAAALGAPLSWGAMLDPTAPWIADPEIEAGPPADVQPVVPRCAVADAGARSRARQRFGARWIACLTPAVNPRLDRPREAADPPDPSVLRRRLVLARRVGGPVIAVDGIGGWRDDRQLDPVAGTATGSPVSLTTASTYRAYGHERLTAVRDLLLARAGPPPDPIGRPPALLDLVRSPGVLVERLEQVADGLEVRLTDASQQGRYEVLVDDRAFIVSPGLALAYGRTDPAVALDLVFADGARLLDVLPDDGALDVHRPLDPFVGRRVEEVTLVYGGGRSRVDARLVGARIGR